MESVLGTLGTRRHGEGGGDGARVLKLDLQIAAVVERREAAARSVAEAAHLRHDVGFLLPQPDVVHTVLAVVVTN